jgi:hypothetical protein
MPVCNFADDIMGEVVAYITGVLVYDTLYIPWSERMFSHDGTNPCWSMRSPRPQRSPPVSIPHLPANNFGAAFDILRGVLRALTQ